MPVGFAIANISTGLSAQKLSRFDSGLTIGTVVLFSGQIVGMSWVANASKTAGTCSFAAYADDTATGATLTWSSGASASTVFPPGKYTFQGGAVLDVRITTNGSFAPTTADGELILYVGQVQR